MASRREYQRIQRLRLGAECSRLIRKGSTISEISLKLGRKVSYLYAAMRAVDAAKVDPLVQ